MKRTKKFITAGIILIAVIAISQSCKKSAAKPDLNSDKTKLASETDSLTVVYTQAVEGKQAGDYVPGSKAALQTAITLAKGVVAGQFTQQQVNNALANLMRAATQFNINLIQQVSVANLVASWTFSGNANDVSGNGHNGTLQTGWVGPYGAPAVDGATLPVLIADRYGVANSAYHFSNGAYIEVPFDLSLRPSNFTICAWIKPDISSNGNYIFSVDRWNGYKFQLQGGNLPFLTVNTSTGDHDQDDGGTAIDSAGVWRHVAVSYTNGTEKFYIQGKLVKTATVTGTPLAVSSVINLAIGNELPKENYNLTNSSDPNYFYGGDYFMGALDEVRFYNIVLTDAQILSIYTDESSL